MDPGGSGDFTVGEEVVGDEFLAKATATITGDAVRWYYNHRWWIALQSCHFHHQ